MLNEQEKEFISQELKPYLEEDDLENVVAKLFELTEGHYPEGDISPGSIGKFFADLGIPIVAYGREWLRSQSITTDSNVMLSYVPCSFEVEFYLECLDGDRDEEGNVVFYDNNAEEIPDTDIEELLSLGLEMNNIASGVVSLCLTPGATVCYGGGISPGKINGKDASIAEKYDLFEYIVTYFDLQYVSVEWDEYQGQ